MENNRISPPIALKVRSRVGGYARYIRSRFILEKYGNTYQNPTANIKSYWELGSRVPSQFPGLSKMVQDSCQIEPRIVF